MPAEEEEIDTSSDSNLIVKLYVSHDSGIGNIYSDECPSGNPKVVGRWELVFQETIWKIIQELAKKQLKGKGEISALLMSENGLSIYTNQSIEPLKYL